MDKEGFFLKKSHNRREMLKAIAIGGALAMASGAVEAAPKGQREVVNKQEPLPVSAYQYESHLSQEQLEQQKTKAINHLIDGFWNNPTLRKRHMRKYFPECKSREDVFADLYGRSTMRLSSSAENKKLVEKNADAMSELAGQIQDNRYGFFVHGNTQTLYLLQRKGTVIQFVKAYPISASGKKWSKEKNSGGTPPGLHGIAEHVQGQLGEVLSGDKHSKDSEQVDDKYYVKGLDEKGADQIPAVMTGQFMLVSSAAAKVSPNTTTLRGLRGHATNWPAGLGERGTSGGCLRMSNESIRDLGLGNYIDLGKLIGENMVVGGTPVMIHMTPSEIWDADSDDVKERQVAQGEQEVPVGPKKAGSAESSRAKPQQPMQQGEGTYDLDFSQPEKSEKKSRTTPKSPKKDGDTFDLDFGSAH